MWLPTPEQVAASYKFYKAHKNVIGELYGLAQHRGVPTFLLFGPGGNGKSTLKNFLEILSENELNNEYIMSTGLEKGSLKDRRFSRVKVFPGQPLFRDNALDDHYQEVRDLNWPFILMCFSYGYRAIDKEKSLSKGAPQANDEARQEELKYADGIFETLRTMCHFSRYRILTVLLKQDLWWEEKDDVDHFYETEYEPILTKFKQKAEAPVRHQVFPLCLIRSNLKNAENIIIKQHCGSYDDKERLKHRAHFLMGLQDLLRGK